MTKQFIRIISLIMAVIVFPFSGSFVYASKEVVSPRSGCYEELLGEMGIVIEETENVTRATFLTALMTALTVASDPTASPVFNDVTDKYLIGLMPAAVSMGIISSADRFYPDDAITYPQAYKMIIEALGWGNEARYGGGYPTGYMSQAHKLSLDDGVSSRDTLCKNDVLCLLGNMAETAVREIKGIQTDGNESYFTWGTTDSFMYVYHKIYKVSGIIEADNKTYIGDSTIALSKDTVMIDGREYLVSKTAECNVGSNVDAYVREDGAKHTIICASPSLDEKTVVIYPEDLCGYSSGILSFYEETKLKTLRSDLAAVLYNGKAFEHYTDKDFMIRDGFIEAVDNNSDGKIDIFRIWEAEYIAVNMYDTYRGIIHDANTGNTLVLHDDAIVDSDFDMREIDKGDILEVYSSADGMYHKIIRLNKDIEATVTGITSDNKLELDGRVYKMSRYFENTALGKVEIGNTVSVMLTNYGGIAALLETGQTRYILAYLDNCKEEGGLKNAVVVKLFNEFGEVKTLDLSSKATVDGFAGNNADILAKLTEAKGNLIKYSLNSKGEVSAVYTSNGREGFYNRQSDGNESLIRHRFKGDDTTEKVVYKVTGYFIPHFIIDSSTRIICVAENESDDTKRFSIGNGINFLANDTFTPGVNLRPYNVSTDGYARCLLYISDSAIGAQTPSGTAAHGVVVSCTDVLDDDGETVVKVVLYAGNSYNTYYVNKEIETSLGFVFGSNTVTFNKGDVIRYTTDLKGEFIVSAVQDFDATDKKLLHSADDNRELHYYYGDVYSMGDCSVAVREESGRIVYLPFTFSTIGYIDEKDVITAQKSRITTYEQTGENCSKILIKCRYSSPGAVYVFE